MCSAQDSPALGAHAMAESSGKQTERTVGSSRNELLAALAELENREPPASVDPEQHRSVVRSPVGGEWVAAILLVAAVFCAYYPAMRGSWLWDDDALVLDNPVIR